MVVGVIVGLIGVALFAAGSGMVWAQTTQRDADGYITSPAFELATDGHAVTAEGIEIVDEAQPGDWVPDVGDIALRVAVTPQDAASQVFVGIASEDDLDRYLTDVAHAQVTRVAERSGTTYRMTTGATEPAPPADQDFWATSTQGGGTQTLEWNVEHGQWAIAVLNLDASPDLAVTATAGARAPWLTPIAVTLVLAGLVLAGAAAALLVAGARPATGATRPAAAIGAAGAYPLTLKGRLDPQLSRWQWLVKWLLALPHVIVLAFLWLAFAMTTIVAWFAILFTGRYPRGIFDFNVGVMRWTWRVAYYGYGALGTDRYPPFSLSADDYPATLDVTYPEQLSRGLALVKWWLLAIPHYLVVAVFTGSVLSWTLTSGSGNDNGEAVLGGGLIGVLVLIVGVALAVTGRYPAGLFDLIMGLNRWVYRVMAYAALMTDVYPPFRLDLGGDEPQPPPPTPPQTSPAPASARPSIDA
jgi:hypothetical protein